MSSHVMARPPVRRIQPILTCQPCLRTPVSHVPGLNTSLAMTANSACHRPACRLRQGFGEAASTASLRGSDAGLPSRCCEAAKDGNGRDQSAFDNQPQRRKSGILLVADRIQTVSSRCRFDGFFPSEPTRCSSVALGEILCTGGCVASHRQGRSSRVRQDRHPVA